MATIKLQESNDKSGPAKATIWGKKVNVFLLKFVNFLAIE